LIPSESTDYEYHLSGRSILLVYLFPGIGDALLLIPVIQALLRAGVSQPIGVALRHLPRKMLSLVDLPVRFHSFPEVLVAQEYTNITEPIGPPKVQDADQVSFAFHQIVSEIRASEYDLAADLTLKKGIDSRRLVLESGARTTAGWIWPDEDPSASGLSSTTRDCRNECRFHWSQYCAFPLERFGISTVPCSVNWKIPSQSANQAACLWHKDSLRRAVLIPGGRLDYQRWPLTLFVNLGRWLEEELGCAIVVCGAPNEQVLVENICDKLSSFAAPHFGDDIGTLTALVTTANLVLSNNTGPMHIAFAERVPTVALFNEISPVVWGPFHQFRDCLILQHGDNSSSDDTERFLDRIKTFCRLVLS